MNLAAQPTTIAVMGLGHVGLPTALGFAELGWSVMGFDDDPGKRRDLANGEMPFFEPAVAELLRTHLRSGRFALAASAAEAITGTEIIFVCVGTPQRDDGSADLTQIEAVARTIAQHLNGYKLIVEKSTTPVRTAERIKRIIQQHRTGDHRFDVAVNPEFLREGQALHDFFNPDRIVLGLESDRARELLLSIYRPLLQRLPGGLTPSGVHDRVLVTTLNTAELIKHASNAFLATKISFINMMAEICEASGADVVEVARGMGLDSRIGPAFLQAGAGFGGYCFPKDLRALIKIAEDLDVDVALLRGVEQINLARVDRLMQKLRGAVGGLSGSVIGILGLAFKPMTDDIREAPSLRLIDGLLAEGAQLRLHDPKAARNVQNVHPASERVTFCASPYEAAEGAHALVAMTDWDEYRGLDLARLRSAMQRPVLIDGRNLFDPDAARAAGFEYVGTGRM